MFEQLRDLRRQAVMATMDIFGFAHDNLNLARDMIEEKLAISFDTAQESGGSGQYFRWFFPPEGPCVQIRRNSGPTLRWHGSPPQPWHPDYQVLVFVHGQAHQAISGRLRESVSGLSFLETKPTM